ncbi:MAG: hypothetical protein EXR17_05890 [Flavobacteriaceae bacterium]|nr:hypothetical protein [Flavobacteriaceae bacterium]
MGWILSWIKKPLPLFNTSEEESIVSAIVLAEQKTSAEIRVHIGKQKKVGDIVSAASIAFNKLGMQKTAERNGVLIFILPKSKQFAIVGDWGINSKVDALEWVEIRNQMQMHFQQNEFSEGVIHGIEKAGSLLSRYFKPSKANPNEVSNALSKDA